VTNMSLELTNVTNVSFPISLSCFKRVFGTNMPTTLYACYEIISNILGALAVGIYDLITLSVNKNICW